MIFCTADELATEAEHHIRLYGEDRCYGCTLKVALWGWAEYKVTAEGFTRVFKLCKACWVHDHCNEYSPLANQPTCTCTPGRAVACDDAVCTRHVVPAMERVPAGIPRMLVAANPDPERRLNKLTAAVAAYRATAAADDPNYSPCPRHRKVKSNPFAIRSSRNPGGINPARVRAHPLSRPTGYEYGSPEAGAKRRAIRLQEKKNADSYDPWELPLRDLGCVGSSQIICWEYPPICCGSSQIIWGTWSSDQGWDSSDVWKSTLLLLEQTNEGGAKIWFGTWFQENHELTAHKHKGSILNQNFVERPSWFRKNREPTAGRRRGSIADPNAAGFEKTVNQLPAGVGAALWTQMRLVSKNQEPTAGRRRSCIAEPNAAGFEKIGNRPLAGVGAALWTQMQPVSKKSGIDCQQA
ncbi:hypothetical protein K438DRAFT_1764694 [Mycena galopus ATCC 62051]|nr:hypothetical protein K438DRAFT_1764694 [Mycena galopus ATCC 62051]